MGVINLLEEKEKRLIVRTKLLSEKTRHEKIRQLLKEIK